MSWCRKSSSRSLPAALAAVVVLWAIVLWAVAAWAGPGDHDWHYQRGRQFFAKGQYKAAAEEFAAAYQVKPSPHMLPNMATAFLRQGEYQKALHLYELYLRSVPNAPDRGLVEGYIKEASAAVQAQRKDAERRSAEQERLRAEAERKAAEQGRLRAEAERKAAQAERDRRLAERSRSEAERRALHKRWWLWTAVGVAVAGAAVGAGLGAYYGDPLRGIPVQSYTFSLSR